MTVLSPEKEAWAEEKARELSEGTITKTFQASLLAARWACLWIDRYKELTDDLPFHSKSRAEMVQIIDQAYRESLAQAHWVPRSALSQQPNMSTLNLAIEVFCLSFGEQYEDARALAQIGRYINRHA